MEEQNGEEFRFGNSTDPTEDESELTVKPLGEEDAALYNCS